ncbi:MAG: peptidase T [Spirochaetaceae bacterium]|jgi:tripeptide aminopeptidase|nr:peptidase T [Spirochaetaceae bacterium]
MKGEAKIKIPLLERFKRYAAICTTSDRLCEATPSTEGQWELARLLLEELAALGVNAELTSHCYVIARIDGVRGVSAGETLQDEAVLPVIGFLAHLDTSSDVSGQDVCVITRQYSGETVKLKNGICLDPSKEDGLAKQKGIVVHGDGSTLLGADDKAGIAAIMTALEYLLRHPEIPRPDLEIIFSPDEETGKGLPHLPLEKLKSIYCYTVDGGPAPEIEAECFNAWQVDARFLGKSIHPGEARGKLVNAALMAAYFASLFPRNESPEASDGYYGYYCLTGISGSHEEAAAQFIVRDFEQEGIERRLRTIEAFARATEAAFPGGKVGIKSKQSYLNMKQKIDAAPEVLDKLREACRAAGIEPRLKPIRGGTDGSRLTELGIPTPNIWTGGRNFHSRAEWLSLDELYQSVLVIIELARAWAS